MSVLSGSIDINLTSFSDTINSGAKFGDYFTAGFATQGNTMGIAAGITVAVGLLIGALMAVFGIVFAVLGMVDKLKARVQ